MRELERPDPHRYASLIRSMRLATGTDMTLSLLPL
jgi:hypothetical protein